jgi:catechol 2,3-dioxygenase-like lactoylglutathione lyase family enzyme
MPVREFFHLIHVVDDYDEAEAWYDALFAPQLFVGKNWFDVEKRWASLAIVADTVIEVLEPSDAPEDQQMPLRKFRTRFGQHFHSLAWYVDQPDMQPLFSSLLARGVRIAQPGGGLFDAETADPGDVFFTHPKDTFGQLEFMSLLDSVRERDPRLRPSWSPSWWRDQHPLGIERVSHYTTIVRDLDRARDVYVDGLGGRVLAEVADADAESVFVLVGTDTVVELARPTTGDSRLARDLADHGELPHACTFAVRDLELAERHIEKVGVRIAERRGESITLDPDDCYGAVYAFTERAVVSATA